MEPVSSSPACSRSVHLIFVILLVKQPPSRPQKGTDALGPFARGPEPWIAHESANPALGGERADLGYDPIDVLLASVPPRGLKASAATTLTC